MEVSHIGVALLVLALLQGTPGRRYWPISVDSLATGRVLHTHVEVRGRVKLVRHEGDGDLHIQLTGTRASIVAECIPQLPCRVPKIGERVTVRGISRYDAEHHWQEVHPIEWISP